MSHTKDLSKLARTLDTGTSGQVLTSQGGSNFSFADAASGGSSVTSVANQSAMLAISSPSVGDMVYRSDNSKLMMYNGTGWYVLATIQSTPTVSSVSQTTNSSTSTIAANGTFAMTAGQNTVVTIIGADADEGTTLTHSATVTSGTQSNVLSSLTQSANVFTLAPSTSVGGTITIRFDVSDSTSTGNQSASFSISFISGPDISAGTQDGTSYNWTNNAVGNAGAPSNLQWKPDGTKFFIGHLSNTASYGYDMRSMTSWTVSTPFSLNSAHISKDSGYFDVSQSTPIPNPGLFGFVRNAHISDNGLKIHLVADNNNIFQYDLTSAWDVTAINTSSGTKINCGGAAQFNYGNDLQRAMSWGDSGNYLYVFNETEFKVYQASLSTPYDMTSTWSNIKSLSIPYAAANGNATSSFQVNSIGDTMIMIHRTGKMTEWDLSTNWDISSATTSASNDITVANTGTAAGSYKQIAVWYNASCDTLFYSVPTGSSNYSDKTGTLYKITGV